MVLSSPGVVLRSPGVSPKCYAISDMFFIASSQTINPSGGEGVLADAALKTVKIARVALECTAQSTTLQR